MLITPEMVERARAQIAEKRDHSPVERVSRHPALKARQVAKGLEYPLPAGPLVVLMEDDIVHTIAFPCCCDPDCICYQHEREQISADRQTEKKPKRRRRTYAVTYDAPAWPHTEAVTFLQQLMR